MIKVKRPACPEVLQIGSLPASPGEIETRRNISGGGSRAFKVYADKAVRKVLQGMFHGKCAYCESRITTIYSGDIEHFRPKGGGYYWLAADWDNLLFACPFCNQTYTHAFTVNGEVKELVQGKRDQFPLSDESRRMGLVHAASFLGDPEQYMPAYDAEEEVRLLLRPCTDKDIEAYFSYTDEGLIRVAAGMTGPARQRAQVSIDTFALQRLGLVLAREARLVQIKAQIRRVEEAIEDFDAHIDDPEELRTWYESVLREEMETLARFQDDDQEYAGMARWVIGKYFRELGFE